MLNFKFFAYSTNIEPQRPSGLYKTTSVKASSVLKINLRALKLPRKNLRALRRLRLSILAVFTNKCKGPKATSEISEGPQTSQILNANSFLK